MIRTLFAAALIMTPSCAAAEEWRTEGVCRNTLITQTLIREPTAGAILSDVAFVADEVLKCLNVSYVERIAKVTAVQSAQPYGRLPSTAEPLVYVVELAPEGSITAPPDLMANEQPPLRSYIRVQVRRK